MDKLVLESSMRTDITSISNIFVDEYMPKANGDFVKVYIHLLRLVNSKKADVALDAIADVFNFTEKDILRALKYWEGLGLLSLVMGQGNIIRGIRLEPFGSGRHYIKGVHSMQINPTESDNMVSLPEKRKYSAREIADFTNDNTLGQLMFIAQTYLAHPLSSAEMNCVFYMYDALGLSSDLIEYIMETCVSEGNSTMRQIEKFAVGLYSKGIKDVASAKKYHKGSSNLASKVLSAFGISGRLPGKEEKNFILKWHDDLGFGEDMIIEACDRSIAHTHTPSFDYADRILKNWHEAGVKNFDGIAQYDKAHAQEFKKKAAAKKVAGVSPVKHKGGQKIANRSYDFPSLEKQLTGLKED